MTQQLLTIDDAVAFARRAAYEAIGDRHPRESATDRSYTLALIDELRQRTDRCRVERCYDGWGTESQRILTPDGRDLAECWVEVGNVDGEGVAYFYWES